MIGVDSHADMVLACDLVLNTPDPVPDSDLLEAIDLLSDPKRPADNAHAHLRAVLLLWLLRELGRDAVAQVRARHAHLMGQLPRPT